MKILTLICTIFLFNSFAHSQTEQNSSDKLLFNVSMKTIGMVGRNECNSTINRTVYIDGRFEQEDCQNTKLADNSQKIPVKIEKKVEQDQIDKFIKFIEDSGFLTANDEYLGKAHYTDLAIITTFTYRNKATEKKVVVINYDPYDLSIPCFIHRLFSLMPSPNPN